MSKVVCLEKLDKKDFLQVWQIMENSFPPEEHRTRVGQEDLLENSYYQLYGYKNKNVVAAFFAVWQFEEFAFVEHFAVAENYRNGGIGAQLLKELLVFLDMPIVLEVELPEEELPQRRIRFYERNGFVLNGYDYVQPPMQAERKAIPLRIMSYPGILEESQFKNVRETLYREVYHVR